MIKKIVGGILIVLLIFSAFSYFYVKRTYPETKPILAMSYFFEHVLHPHAKLDKHVLGFIPYWQLENASAIKPEYLSELNYFSLSVDYDGTIIKELNGETEPGWNSWNKQETKDLMTKAKIMGAKTTITVSALQNDIIESVLDSPEAQQILITAIAKEVKERKLDGVNIDFEYIGEVDSNYVLAFTSFSQNLKTTLKKQNPKIELTLSIMPLASSENNLFAFTKLVPFYDRFVGMSYDYYGQNAQISGPTAPMKGFKEGNFFFDIVTTYGDYQKVIPKEKLLMGVAYYGWERTVLDGKTLYSRTYDQANANNYTAVISYTRAKASNAIKKAKCTWDNLAQETWCWYVDPETGLDHQAWIADDRSVQARFDFTNKEKLGGIAIWTMGQDIGHNNLWNKITASF